MDRDRTKTSAVLIALCVLFPLGTAFAEQDTSLIPPLGFLEIVDGPEGTISLRARCVESQRVLDAIAPRAGVTLTSELPIRVYVSLYPESHEARFRTPFKWIEQVAQLSSLRLIPTEEPSHYRLEILDPERNPFLTDEEVRVSYKAVPVAPLVASQESDVKTGIVIVNGTLVRPPFRLSSVNLDSTTASIRINDIPCVRVFGAASLRSSSIPEDAPLACPPSLPESGQFDTIKDMTRYVSGVLYPSLLSQNGGHVALAARGKTLFFGCSVPWFKRPAPRDV